MNTNYELRIRIRIKSIFFLLVKGTNVKLWGEMTREWGEMTRVWDEMTRVVG